MPDGRAGCEVVARGGLFGKVKGKQFCIINESYLEESEEKKTEKPK